MPLHLSATIKTGSNNVNMVVKGDQEKIRALLKDTITLLCKNGLNYNAEFCIEALIGITLDKDDVFLVSINETVKNGLLEAKGSDSELEAVSVDTAQVVSHQPRKRRGPSVQPQHRAGTTTPRVKAEQHSDEDVQDIQEIVDYNPHVDMATPPPGKRRRGPVEKRALIKQEPARGNSWGAAPQGQDDQTANNSFMATDGSGEAVGGVSEDADLSHVLHSGALVPLSRQTEDGANWTDTSMHSTSENATDVNDPNQGYESEAPQGMLGFRPEQLIGPGTDKVCQICGRMFQYRKGFVEHMRLHNGQYRYHCDVCGKGFMIKSQYEDHLNVHANRKPFECSVCGKCYPSRKSLRKHMMCLHEPGGKDGNTQSTTE